MPVPINIRSTPGTDFLDGLIPEEEYAARRGVSVRTCQRDRQLRQSPPFITVGRRIYYRVESIREWLVQQERGRLPVAGRRQRSR